MRSVKLQNFSRLAGTACLIAAATLAFTPASAQAETFTYHNTQENFIGYSGPQYGVDEASTINVHVPYILTRDSTNALSYIMSAYGAANLHENLPTAHAASLEQRLILFYGAPNVEAPQGLTETQWAQATQVALWCSKQAGLSRFALKGLYAVPGQEDLFSIIYPAAEGLLQKAQGKDPFAINIVSGDQIWKKCSDSTFELAVGTLDAGGDITCELEATGLKDAQLIDAASKPLQTVSHGDVVRAALPQKSLTGGYLTVSFTPDKALPLYTIWSGEESGTAKKFVLSSAPHNQIEPTIIKIATQVITAVIVDENGKPRPGEKVIVDSYPDQPFITDENGAITFPATETEITITPYDKDTPQDPVVVTVDEGKTKDVEIVVPNSTNQDNSNDAKETTVSLKDLSDCTVYENQAIPPIKIMTEPADASISTTSLPEGLIYAPEKGVISGTPTIKDWKEGETSRSSRITVTASNGDAVTSKTCTITIIRSVKQPEDPQAPSVSQELSLTVPDNQRMLEHKPIDPLTVKATPDNATIKVSGLPTNLTFDDISNTIKGTPRIDKWGKTEEERSFLVSVMVVLSEKSLAKDFTITVLRDTDKDGVPDITDTDDDNDGFTDEEERKAGTDPKDPNSKPTRTTDKDAKKGSSDFGKQVASTKKSKQKLPKTHDVPSTLTQATGLMGLSVLGAALVARKDLHKRKA